MDLADLVRADSGGAVIRPILHFLLIGALLFGARGRLEGGGAVERIVIRAETIARLRDDWARRTGRTPGAAELRALVDAAVDEEVFLRTALDLGLERSDPVARRRLVENVRFLSPDAAMDDDECLRQALSLGMERTDPVVRRRLVQAVEQHLRAGGRGAEPTAEELRRHLQAHPGESAAEARIRFSHVFLSSDLRGGRLEEEARRVLASLREGREAAGDPFLFGREFASASPREIARMFGETFAASIAEAPDGAWTGPLRSAYGLHLVRVEERRTVRPAPEEALRRARYGVYAAREARALAEGRRELRAGFRIEIEGDPAA